MPDEREAAEAIRDAITRATREFALTHQWALEMDQAATLGNIRGVLMESLAYVNSLADGRAQERREWCMRLAGSLSEAVIRHGGLAGLEAMTLRDAAADADPETSVVVLAARDACNYAEAMVSEFEKRRWLLSSPDVDTEVDDEPDIAANAEGHDEVNDAR